MPRNQLHTLATSIRRAATALPLLLVLVLMPAALAVASARHHRKRAHAAGGCPGADAPASRAAHAEMRAAVLCLVNRQRTARGLPALSASAKLDRSAQHWTRIMTAENQLTHGSDFSARISAAGYRWRSAGENIAAGFATPRAVVDGWMGSNGHCQNILDPNFANAGTGVVNRGVMGVGASTWTQDFGLRTGRHAPSGNTGPMNGCPYR